VAARLGYGTNNMASGGTYAYNTLSRNRSLLDRTYRGSWIVGAAVDAPADDMFKAGVAIKADLKPEEIKSIQTRLRKTGTWNQLANVARWARLYGGCIGVIMIDGQHLATELRPETVARGSYRGIAVLDRWMVNPTLDNLVSTPGPALGKPMYYRVQAGSILENSLIHHSRVVRMDGVELPYWERQAEMGWGMSVLERIYDRLLGFDSTTQGVAQLVYKAHLRVMKVKDLRTAIAASGKAIEGVVRNLELIRAMQNNEGMTVIDAEDEFTALTYSFAGLSDVMLQFAQQLSGALKVPMVRLFGQTPTGLNTSGESDLRMYYDNIGQEQEATARDPLDLILRVVHKSELGIMPGDDFDFEFEPLWRLTDEQKATVSGAIVTAVSGAMDAGIIDRTTAMRELKQSSEVTGVFSNISDEDIQEAEAAPPPMGELGTDEVPEVAGAVPGGGAGDETDPALPPGGPDPSPTEPRLPRIAQWPKLPGNIGEVVINADDMKLRIV
jgi:phage-related protein (TIGR01555 family)